MRATIAWSYDLLAPQSAAVLRRAGVFAGSCDLGALATVALLTWSLGSSAADPAPDGERVAIGLRLAQALGQFWNIRSHAGEGRRWLQRAVDLAAARSALNQCIAICREIGNEG